MDTDRQTPHILECSLFFQPEEVGFGMQIIKATAHRKQMEPFHPRGNKSWIEFGPASGGGECARSTPRAASCLPCQHVTALSEMGAGPDPRRPGRVPAFTFVYFCAFVGLQVPLSRHLLSLPNSLGGLPSESALVHLETRAPARSAVHPFIHSGDTAGYRPAGACAE